MVIRIQFGQGPKVSVGKRKNRRMASATAALLGPVVLIALALGIWRLAADLNWTNRFAIPSGLFSHWQVWLAAAALLQVCSHFLNRYGNGQDEATS